MDVSGHILEGSVGATAGAIWAIDTDLGGPYPSLGGIDVRHSAPSRGVSLGVYTEILETTKTQLPMLTTKSVKRLIPFEMWTSTDKGSG